MGEMITCPIHAIRYLLNGSCPKCKEDDENAHYLWKLTDEEIADECTRYSIVHHPTRSEIDMLNNNLAVLFEASSRILKNQIKIKKQFASLRKQKKGE